MNIYTLVTLHAFIQYIQVANDPQNKDLSSEFCYEQIEKKLKIFTHMQQRIKNG